jgi:hypothetical protein
VHLPEAVLEGGRLGRARRRERVRMDLRQRKVAEREAEPIADPRFDPLDLAVCLSRVRTLVIPVLEDQMRGSDHATDVVDPVVDRLQGDRTASGWGVMNHGDAESACPANRDGRGGL